MSVVVNVILLFVEVYQQNVVLYKVLVDELIDFVDFGCSVGGFMLEM